MAVPIPVPAQAAPTKEGHEGGVLSILLLLFGAGLAYLITPILSALLALLVFYLMVKFIKWRVDPMDMFFWMKHKPSWAAIGLTFLSGLLLLGISYFVYAYVNGHTFIDFHHLLGFGL